MPDPFRLYYNPEPPVEFGAWGVDVPVAWREGGRIVATGNSFAAPHVAGLAALVLSKHPGLTPFELKAVLAAAGSSTDRVETKVSEHRRLHLSARERGGVSIAGASGAEERSDARASLGQAAERAGSRPMDTVDAPPAVDAGRGAP